MLIEGILSPDIQIGIKVKVCGERLIETHCSWFQLKFLSGKLSNMLCMVGIMIINSGGYPVLYSSNFEFAYLELVIL